jgi:hypothetical protein
VDNMLGGTICTDYWQCNVTYYLNELVSVRVVFLPWFQERNVDFPKTYKIYKHYTYTIQNLQVY